MVKKMLQTVVMKASDAFGHLNLEGRTVGVRWQDPDYVEITLESFVVDEPTEVEVQMRAPFYCPECNEMLTIRNKTMSCFNRECGLRFRKYHIPTVKLRVA